MPDDRDAAPYREAPEGALGGEGEPFDQTVLAPTTDGEIERGIRTALELVGDLEADHFAIEVEDGVVRLIAPGASPDQRRRAAELAGLVHGVRRVVDTTDR